MKMKFYKCLTCGKIHLSIEDKNTPTICCGKQMIEIIPNTTDGALEKHVPQYKVESNKLIVTVGSIQHPMMDNHYIQWICVTTDKGYQFKYLSPNSEPTAEFILTENETVDAVYEYCNLHGLFANK